MLEKWPFLDQNHGLTRFEKCQFFDFLDVFFYRLERCFFAVEYRKRHFPGLYCLKKICWKKGHFFSKTMGSTLWTIFPNFWTSCFYSLERCFFVLEYRKRPCCSLYCPKKKKKRKNGHFWTKSMVLPIWKNVNIHGVNPWFWSKNGPFSNFSF